MPHFPHRNLLGIDQLSVSDIETILDLAKHYAQQNRSAHKTCDRLAGKIIVNMFFEDSTRTRSSFEIAAKRLGAEVVNFNVVVSSMNKGESYGDTLRTLAAMQVDGFVIRHKRDGAVEEATHFVDVPVLNAGDGVNEHPTQALLDALTLLRHKGTLKGLKVAVCGDIKHSRVARANALLLTKMGASVHFFAPPQFEASDASALGAVTCATMEEAISSADAILMLRIQKERLAAGLKTITDEAYHAAYGLNHERLKLAKPDVVVYHPSPLNRGIEITSALADDRAHSVIFEQIEMGVAVRMACLDLLLGGVR